MTTSTLEERSKSTSPEPNRQNFTILQRNNSAQPSSPSAQKNARDTNTGQHDAANEESEKHQRHGSQAAVVSTLPQAQMNDNGAQKDPGEQVNNSKYKMTKECVESNIHNVVN